MSAKNSAVFQAYEVTKQHHRMGWLNQRRAIVVTLTEVLICKVTSTSSVSLSQLTSMDDEVAASAQTITNVPLISLDNASDSLPSLSAKGNNSNHTVTTATLLIRKRFLYDRVESVGVKGSDSFCLRVQGDHDYFFWTMQALIVALEIQKRLDALRSVKLLVSGSSLDPKEITELLRSFFSGELQLPQFVHSADNTKRRRSIIGNNMLSTPSGSFAGSPMTGDSARPAARGCSVKENEYLETLALRQALLQAYQGGYFPSTSASVKRIVENVQHESPEMIFLHSLRDEMNEVREEWLEKIRTFCRPGKLLGNKFPILSTVFKDEDDDGFDYADHDEEEVNSVDELLSRVADDVLQDLVYLPLYDALWESLHLESSVVGQQRAYDKNVNRFSSLSPDSLSSLPASLETVNFDYALSHFGYLKQRRCPTAHLDMLVNIAKSIVLTIEASDRVRRRSIARTIPLDVETPQSPVRQAPPQQDSSPSSPSSPVARQPAMALPTVGRAMSSQQTALSADDLLPVYIHLLSKSSLTDAVLLREWISRLCDPKEISERTYYLTTFSCAVEFIVSGGQAPEHEDALFDSRSPPALDRSTSLPNTTS